MDADRDLSASLPDSPPPRPDRREAAIAEALRRFDGAPPAAPAPRATPARRRTWRPQIAAFASVMLVAVVAVPIWLNDSRNYQHTISRPATPPAAPQATPRTNPTVVAELEREAIPPPAPAKPPAARVIPPPAVVSKAAAPVADAHQDSQLNRLPAVAPPPAPPPPPPPSSDEVRKAAAQQAPAARAAATPSPSQELIVTGSRVRRRDYAAATPLVTVGANLVEASDGWNRCTLDDPAHDLANCRTYADPGARGARGRAAAQFADGMTHAWAGDLDAAIAAFDRAIAQSPLAIAYLNRALAWQRQGDTRRARADFDSAVRGAPDDPRTHYYRSRFYRERGDTVRAQADANRAIDIDPGYARLLR